MVPESEEVVHPNPALTSVASLAGDLLSTVCQWTITRLVEDVLLVGEEGAEETYGVEETWIVDDEAEEV